MLEERITQCGHKGASKIELESVDVTVTRLLNHSSKKVEVRGKEVPYSKENLLC